MKFTLIISAVAAININDKPPANLAMDHQDKGCKMMGQSYAPVVTAKCSDIPETEQWSVTDWINVRHKTTEGCKENCCYSLTLGRDAELHGMK